MQHRPEPLCGPDCKYRGLYEGTRLSLADLSARFREAVGRYGRLRNNQISVMKRAYPAQFTHAERQIGMRMLDANDETLIAYLTAFAQQAELSDPNAGAQALRHVLASAGYDLPAGNDLASWAEAIRAAQEIPPPSALAGPSDLQGPDLVNVFDETQAPEVWDPATHDLAALFADDEPAGAADSAARPVPAAETEQAAPSGPPAVPPSGTEHPAKSLNAARADRGQGDRHDADSPSERPTADTASTPEPGRSPAGQVRAPWATAAPGEETAPAPAAGGGAVSEQPSAKTAEVAPQKPAEDGASTGGSEAAGDGADAAAPKPAPKPASRPDSPMKPQLFPAEPKSRRGKAKKRAVTATASAPGPRGADVPQAGNGDGTAGLDQDIHDKFLAQVILPHPVFTSDLAELAGSDDVVQTWEQACRDDRDSPVRFIPPKARHRARGALVLPYSFARQAASEFKRTWWAACLDRYRGARLYELGVLLHRVGPTVLSFELGEHHMLLRCNQPRGMVGIVVIFDADLARSSDTRESLVKGVEQLLDNPLTMLAVLTTNHDALEPAISAVEEEARERGWKPPFPVIAARSWEYAADQGHSAKLVLGE